MKAISLPDVEIYLKIDDGERRLVANCSYFAQKSCIKFEVDHEMEEMDQILQESFNFWQHVLLVISPNFGYDE